MLYLFGDDYWWRSTEISKDWRSDFDAHGVLHSPDPFEFSCEVEWQWDWAGFTFDTEQFKPGVMPVHRLKIFSVPYWSVVIPLERMPLKCSGIKSGIAQRIEPQP